MIYESVKIRNRILESNSDYTIILDIRDRQIIVDTEDLLKISIHKWVVDGGGYCTAKTKVDETGKFYDFKIHRLVMDARKGESVDHKNRNKLDNRKENLRICTQQQNVMNVSKYTGFGLYKGVRKHKDKWRATIQFNKKKIHLGLFKTQEEAAIAYNESAIKYFNEFAYLNVIV